MPGAGGKLAFDEKFNAIARLLQGLNVIEWQSDEVGDLNAEAA